MRINEEFYICLTLDPIPLQRQRKEKEYLLVFLRCLRLKIGEISFTQQYYRVQFFN